MSEPGKYVLLKKVQPSSKNIKKAEKQKEKRLKKKLQKVQPKKLTQEIPKRNGTNKHQPNEKIGKKKKKAKQNQLKGNINEKFSVQSKKTTAENESQRQGGARNKKPKMNSDVPSPSSKKTFGDDLSDRLKASRFRFINEQLYTQTADKAIDVFDQDDLAFTAYHDGYRKQIEQWPINPLNRILKSIKKLYVYEFTFSFERETI